MSNSYLDELIRRIENRYAIDSDTMSMGDWLCVNTSLKGRPFSFDRYPFQKGIANDMHPNMDVIKPSQVGLALDVTTPVITPSGWSTMGDLKVGDQVFDEQGQPTKVTYVSPVYLDHDCFEVTFDTGETVVADANHRWYVECDKAFNDTDLCYQTGRLPKKSDWRRKGVVRTEMLSRNYKVKKRNLFAIPTTGPLQLPDQDLLIDPYVLGLWLGDGSSASASLTAHPEDQEEYQKILAARGYELLVSSDYSSKINIPETVRRHRLHEFCPEKATFFGRLTQLNVLNNKHIPQQYLQASVAQRLDLLRGLMDTDGSVTKEGRLSFHNCNKILVEGVAQLAHSLGFKTRTRWRDNTNNINTLKNGHEIRSRQVIAEVSFVAYQDQCPFLLSRKASRVKQDGRRTESFRRRIVSVEKVPSRPVRCIAVDAPSHLFLCGKGMIPTHNTEIQIRKSLGFVARHRGTTLIFTMPNEKMFKRMSITRIKPLVEEEKVFNLETRSGEKPTRSMGLYQIGSSFMFVTGATEGDATSISADAVMNDEVDLTDQQMLALFNSRMQDSDWKLNQRFSTPTFGNYGVDKGYSMSDQHQYLCKCNACNHWNAPIFRPQFVEIPGLTSDINDLTEIDEQMIDRLGLDLVNAYVKCERCHAPLDLGGVENREWVPKFQSRTHHRGYRVSPFSTSRLGIDYIVTQLLKYKARGYLRGWYNTVLGEAYTDGNARLSDADINACFTGQSSVPAIDPHAPTWLGIDIGLTCHLVVGQGDSMRNMHIVRFIEIPETQLRSTVEELLGTYNVVGGACDRHPYTPTANELRDLSEGVILPVEYRGKRDLALVKDPEGEHTSHAQIWRTAMIDTVAAGVRGKNFRFSGYGHHREIIVEHLKDMVRDESPEKEATWIKLNNNDHYFHGLVFLATAVRIREFEFSTTLGTRATVGAVIADLDNQKSGLLGRTTQKKVGLL